MMSSFGVFTIFWLGQFTGGRSEYSGPELIPQPLKTVHIDDFE